MLNSDSFLPKFDFKIVFSGIIKKNQNRLPNFSHKQVIFIAKY